jgi:hypothetical protein
MEFSNKEARLFKRIGAESSSKINELWKVIRNAFTEVSNEDSIEAINPNKTNITSKLSENILEGKSEDKESEARNTSMVVYYHCLSQTSIRLGLLGSINEFLLVYPNFKVDQLDFFARSLITQMQVEVNPLLKIVGRDRLKLRYYLIQTLTIIASYHNLKEDKEKLNKLYEVLLHELNYTIRNNNAEWLSDWFELKDAQWIERKEKWSLIIGGYKYFSYIKPKSHITKLYIRYVLLYYICRLIKISAEDNLAKIYDKVYSNTHFIIIKNSLHISQMQFQELTDEEREEQLIEILNECFVMMKCLVRLLDVLPNTHDQFKFYFKSKFKSTVADHLLLIEKLKSQEVNNIAKILHVFNSFLLITSRRFPNEEEFIADNEVYNFYERCNKCISPGIRRDSSSH